LGGIKKQRVDQRCSFGELAVTVAFDRRQTVMQMDHLNFVAEIPKVTRQNLCQRDRARPAVLAVDCDRGFVEALENQSHHEFRKRGDELNFFGVLRQKSVPRGGV